MNRFFGIWSAKNSRLTRSGRSWAKKKENCTEKEKQEGLGDCWDIDVIDVRSRAVIVRRHGLRSEENINAALAEARERLRPDHVPGLITTDGYSPYVEGVLGAFGREKPVAKKAARGRPSYPEIELPAKLVYAQVDKKRSKTGCLESVESRLIFGTEEQLAERLQTSSDSDHVNTAFIERFNGSDRHFNPRKARKVCTFSKTPFHHNVMSWMVLVVGIFCWPVRSLAVRRREENGDGSPRTPAMELNCAEHVMNVGELMRLRPVGFRAPTMKEIATKRRRFREMEPLPRALELWPRKSQVRKTLKGMNVPARGYT